jgi:TolB-like protein/Tfp pilus assembly protein PilF/tRNA A-37 threonylcarbamoyl transferase component Bud32
MMPPRLETVEEIFHAALDCAPDQLSAFLEKKCAGDESLRRKVEELLAAHRQPESLIEGPLATLAASVVASGQTNSSVGQAISNYEILGEIGRGGMGVIYRARQRHSTRIVALKRIVSYHADSRETLERFRREAEAAASLDHPNILPIYEIGQGEDGLPFFSMKYAAGGSLQKAGSALRSKSRECVVRLMAKVARAVQYAHEHGVLHRDLKPGNVLLDSRGEPFVTDFGLAKWLDTNTDLTRTLTIFGTPGYIAPEQAKGPAAKLTAAADVYSLGAILFNLFTGRTPFLGEHALAVIQQATERPAPKLRSLAPALDRDLETICARCLEREPDARYRTAGALAEDLERWLEGRPISARPVRAPARVWRWSRRNPILAGALAGCVLLAFAVIFLLGEKFFAPKITAPEKSIAVLPFENLSRDPDNASFTNGVQDEILTALARIAGLKVISRTSVTEYKSGIVRDLREIGQQLGVAHVLEGSVQRFGNRVRVNAQLVDARTDAHLWAQSYDRDLADVFAIQSDIAKAIANELQVKLTVSEQRAIAQPATTDLTAFLLYNRAKSLLVLTTMSTGLEQKFLQAVDFLNQAVARDPSFFLAYCQLAYTHDQLYFLGFDHTPARLALAEAAIQAAFRLCPNAGEAHLARGENLFRGRLDYDGALAELDIARPTLPNDPRIFELTGSIQGSQGKHEEALRNLERALQLDPRNLHTAQKIAIPYSLLRRYAEAAAVLDRCLAINPNEIDTRVARAHLDLYWKANPRPLHQIIDLVRAENPGAVPTVADRWFIYALAERDASAAEAALEALGKNTFGNDAVQFRRAFCEGLIARMTNDEIKARSAFSVARAEQEKRVQAQPNYGPALCVLGLIDAGLGRKEEALREGRRAIELMPVKKDFTNGVHMIEYFAQIAAWVGEKDLACEQLAIATRLPGYVSYGELKLLPWWDPLRGDPCFEKIVASLAPK